ncbi:MAG: acetyl/propionyl/methylcrotonyl-CoA carboxylase subunit alpha [Rhizobiales bacterium]|nr:acetyl/propionyl/methylcrotonyl-CoA carboxylase subunit alpha [Hyphomicrobiales bacterium]MBI3672286.1 acetyl/propionyl/methylcrotonyl-CoA carboxylase subunit alpha [Hyphomicrobiales bacterium]
MFKKLLIANRGEIAVRIARTARRLGIRTAAVYSDADAEAMHTAVADEAFRIGPPPAAESYLDRDAIIVVARKCGAEAVHPGYGFLAENPDFAEAVVRAGLIFVGPPAAAIRAMGLKDEAKRLMQKAGVPLLPGYHEEDQQPARLAAEAQRVGWPVLIKPVAGGGGKGMRRVERAADFTGELERAKREAVSAFGDGRVLIEKYLTKARHIEIQVMADAHGNVIHLFERDCSLQRRHQKVIEETPAPGMTPEMRERMCAAAISAAKAVGYVGAGTVEFIADVNVGLRPDRFYFMEMNTRLQVEHPVTEMITGLDLVELQLRAACGETLPVRQADVAMSGHAVEARLYAEDPARDFRPQTGRILHLKFPEDPNLRIDCGVRTGDMVTPHYDPMLGKLIVGAPSRDQAFERLARVLAASQIAGCRTNLAFLHNLVRHPAVLAGEVDTGLIERDIAGLLAALDPALEAVAVALLLEGGYLAPPRSQSPFDTLTGFRLWPGEAHHASFLIDGKTRAFGLMRSGNLFEVTSGDRMLRVAVLEFDHSAVRLDCGDRIVRAAFFRHDDMISVALNGTPYEFGLASQVVSTTEEGGGLVVSPVPGLIRKLCIKAGEEVRRGDMVAIVEAMKMEFPLKAERDGRVLEIHAAEGTQIAEGTAVATIGNGNG